MPNRTARARKAALSLLAAGAVVGGLLTGTTPASAAPGDDGVTRLTRPASYKDGRYIVVLRAPSATQYDGGTARLAPTRARGRAFDARTRAVRAYTDHLRRTHRAIAEEVDAQIATDYTMAINGFSARLTGTQATELSRDRRVLLLQADSRRQLDTSTSPDFLGLTGKKGAWTRNGGKSNAGAGTVVGVLDSGIWPESKSFAGARLTSTPKTKYDIHRSGQSTFMDKADGTRFAGACETGDEFAASACNTKLIGARFYPESFLAMDEEDRSPKEFLSPRDGDGHGTHTAGTAAGNPGVPARVEGRSFGKINGMAPAARVAAYKVCFSDNDPDSGDCYTSSSIAGIDDAVADGVDVINYSISGSTDTVVDLVELAFEGAAEAGIFVATSAGNSGPEASTVAHPSPWLTTVAASTHVSYENTVKLGNGQKIVGASIADEAVPSTPLIDSTDAALAGADAEEAALCAPDTLDPSQASGKIVVCTRGVYDRVAKSAEVERAGGVAVILANPSPNSLDADFHAVPTVHLDDTGAAKVWDYIEAAGANATAAFKLGNRTRNVTPLPQIAGFSSRGPSLANDADILKPDISAPGQSVLAAVAPPTNSARDFDLYSGTSMASPHVAGLGAFLASRRPNWTPMQIKSAMMTTARSLVDADNRKSRDAFAQGAGNVRPKRFFDPGLFVTSTPAEWLGFLADQGLETGYAPVEARDVNQPSMAQGQVVQKASFTRRFVSTMKGTWKVSVKVPGFSATTSTSNLVTSRKNDVEDLTVDFTRTDAPIGQFTQGFVTLTGPTTVRMPVALRPVAVAAPSEVEGTGTSGSAEVEITPGVTGELAVNESGLAEADTSAGTVENTDAGSYDDYCVTISDTGKVLRANLDALPEGSGDYLDMYAYVLDGDCATGNIVDYAAIAATGGSDESFTLADPEPGSYIVSVELFEVPEGEDSVGYVLDIFNVDADTTLGDFHAEPNPVPVIAGQDTSFAAVWSGLAADRRYLGVLEYEGALGPTYVSVDTTQQGP